MRSIKLPMTMSTWHPPLQLYLGHRIFLLIRLLLTIIMLLVFIQKTGLVLNLLVSYLCDLFFGKRFRKKVFLIVPPNGPTKEKVPQPKAPEIRPVATPSRDGLGLGGLMDMVPDIGDTTIPRPKPGAIRISSEAVEGRLRRVFLPNVRGQYKVSSEIVEQWKTKKGRKSLEKLFQTCGFCPDRLWE